MYITKNIYPIFVSEIYPLGMTKRKTNHFQNYFSEIKSKADSATEYTFRTAFENLLNEVKPDKKIRIVQEKKKNDGQDYGKPDFYAGIDDLEIGRIETKPYADELEKYINTKQLKRYLPVIPNFIFTNYRDFILYKDGKKIFDSTLFTKKDKNVSNERIEETEKILLEFFTAKVRQIENTLELSLILANHAKYLHDELLIHWKGVDETDFKKKLKSLYILFQHSLIEDLSEEKFIDAYAQTIAYGLFLSALTASKATQKIDKTNFINYIPKSLKLFEEIFSILLLKNIPDSISWIIDKMLYVLNNTEFTKLRNELSFADMKAEEYQDPYIYFYENFLEKYDKAKKKEMGVFYTPIPVVQFIVKSISKILKKDFGKDGFSDDGISVLDFACGTSTFLFEVFKEALTEVDAGLKIKFIKEKLLKNFFGFEYLIAPYTISHLKLMQFLEEEMFKFSDERIQVYLTDTLDDSKYEDNPMFPYVSEEGKTANKIKLGEKLWVVIGNPPYSNYSKNKKPFIEALMKEYKIDSDAPKETDKKKRKEKKNWDDSVKFIRYAQAKITGCKYEYEKKVGGVVTKIQREIKSYGKGVIGIIVNNAFLEGISHPLMRKSLFNTFDKIYILNLHGDKDKQETDENVFPITKGVAICLFVKLEKPLKEKEINYYSSLEHKMMTQEEKFQFLFHNDIDSVKWKKLKPKAPSYWLKDIKENKTEDEWSLSDVFKEYNTAIQTGRDHILIDIQREKLISRVRDILNNKDESLIREKYDIKDSSGWSLAKIKATTFDEKKFVPVIYRPFDNRYIFYDKKALKRDRQSVMRHFIDKENIGLNFKMQNKTIPFSYAMVTNKIVESCLFESAYANNVVAPLYLYPDETKTQKDAFEDEQKKEKKVNFTDDFLKFINAQYKTEFSPEEILGYIYAVLYSNHYRKKYVEFLKINFPKIPFTKDEKLFKKLSSLGDELTKHHLLKESYKREDMPVFAVDGSNKVESIKFNEKKLELSINDTQYFSRFSKEIWEYQIGGYQVIKKFLSYRMGGEELTIDEINHLKRVYACLHITIQVQKRIDALSKNL